MNKLELEKRLSDESLLWVYDNSIKKKYIDGEKLIVDGKRKNCTNVFGLYKGKEGYVIFLTDDERGLPYYIDKFSTESEACQELYEMALTLKRIHEKGL